MERGEARRWASGAGRLRWLLGTCSAHRPVVGVYGDQCGLPVRTELCVRPVELVMAIHGNRERITIWGIGDPAAGALAPVEIAFHLLMAVGEVPGPSALVAPVHHTACAFQLPVFECGRLPLVHVVSNGCSDDHGSKCDDLMPAVVSKEGHGCTCAVYAMQN